MDLDMVRLSVTNVGTSATAVSTSRDETDIQVGGLLEYIKIDLSGAASPDIDIDITVVADTGSGEALTLWGDDDITADTNVCVRSAVVDAANSAIANTAGKLPIQGRIRLDAYDANKASINIDVYVYYSK